MPVLTLLMSFLLSMPNAAQSSTIESVLPSAPPITKSSCPSPAADQVLKLPGRPFATEISLDNCYLFVSLDGGHDNGAVAVVANDGGTLRLVRSVQIEHGSGAGLSLTHDGTLLAVAAEESIVVFDALKLEDKEQKPLIATLPDAGRGAIYTQFSRDDARLFVSEERSASIAVIDVANARGTLGSKAVIARIAVGQAPVGLALSPDGATLFSTSQVLAASGNCAPEQKGGRTHGEGAVVAIDVAKATTDPSHAILSAIRAGCNPVRVVVSPDGRNLWVSQRGSNSVMGVETSAFAPAASHGRIISLEVGQSPVGLAIRPDGTQLWVGNSDRFSTSAGSLTLVTPANPPEAHMSSTFKVGAFPRDLRFMPDGKTLVIALFGEQAIMVHPTRNAGASPH
jgi:DNA-binding beta-propeller fold protein YncE